MEKAMLGIIDFSAGTYLCTKAEQLGTYSRKTFLLLKRNGEKLEILILNEL